MKVRWTPQSLRFPALKGKLIVDTYRGQMRMRAWPRKTGTPKSAEVRRQNKWFKEANDLAKRLEPTQQALAIAMTKGTGLYPRDLLLHQMSGGMYDIIDEDGVNIQTRQSFRETVMFQGVICQLTANQTLPIGLTLPINWPLPVLDTAAFWDVASPGRFTIPAGFNVVSLTAGWKATASQAGQVTSPQIRKNGAKLADMACNIQGVAAGQPSTGPIKVVAGDFFEFGIFVAIAATAQGDQTTFMGLTVLDAD